MAKILGVRIDNLSEAEALERLEQLYHAPKQAYVVTPNPEFLIKAQKDREFKAILNQADLALADGIGLLWAGWLLKQPFKARVTGVDLMERICQRASQKKWPLLLFGGQKGVAEKAVQVLKKKHPGLSIGCLSQIQSWPSQPVILFVALGAPKQEKWITAHLKKFPQVSVAIGVGGAFDFIAGRVRRAPVFMRRAGLEWFWRLVLQPWRLPRIFRAVVYFPLLVIKQKIGW